MKRTNIQSVLLTLLFVAFGAARVVAAEGPATITAPPPNQTIFIGNAVTFTVVADGTAPLSYQWLRGGVPISNATNQSYLIAMTTQGDHLAQFSVAVTNALGGQTSAVAVLRIDQGVLVTNTVTLLEMTNLWRYDTTVGDIGAAWLGAAFNDNSWGSGRGLLYIEDAALAFPKNTLLPGTAGALPTTYYFRTHFTNTFSNAVSLNLRGNFLIDDGCAVYFNGKEAFRLGIAAGATIVFTTPADRTAGDAAPEGPFDLPSTNVFLGDNVVQVEVHQINGTSSDIVMGMSLDADVITRIQDTVRPTVTPLNPPAGATVTSLTQVEVLFSEPVDGVDAGDLLINGAAATGLSFGVPGQFVFSFPQPATGAVQITWAANHGISDQAAAPNGFISNSWSYVLDPNSAPPTLVINEFLAANENGLRDENGDTSDWVELYNPGPLAANLQNWSLTDELLDRTKWRFPYKIMEANSYLLVFASAKDRTNTAGGARLHTNFELGKSGGYLALVDSNTNVISEFNPYPGQSDDVSYGRDRLTPGILGYFTTPTPGTNNTASGAGFAPEVQFSRASGTFNTNAPFDLVLSTPLSNAVIYYAFGTNSPVFAGATFTGNNAAGANTFRYTNGFPIRVTNTAVVRARAFATNLFAGPLATKTYIGLGNQTNVTAFSSDLPIMILHNYGQGAPSATTKGEQYVVLEVFDTDCGRSSMTNAPSLVARGVFHIRGSSTAGYPKGSFFLETQDEFGADKAVSLMGLPEESDWVLYAPNNFEPALFHNPLAMQLARDIGPYASRTRFFELYLKDDSGAPGAITAAEYNGVYVLMEKIKRDKNRLDIARLDAEDVNQPEITGGYAFSIDRGNDVAPLSAGGASLNWIEPNGDDIVGNAVRAPQISYIQGYFNNFNTVLNSANYTNTVTGYPAWIDVNSWVTRHIHEVITFNVDALRLSGYLYKDRNKKIEYGPAWDYDRTQGSRDGRDSNPRTWRSQTQDMGTDFFNFTPWWGRLLTAQDFWQAWIDRYQELRDGALSTNAIFEHIDRFALELAESQPRDRAKWAVPLRLANGSEGGGATYATEVQWKKNWYAQRLDFADTNFLFRPTLSAVGGAVASGFQVLLTPAAKPGSWVIYTLDGTDPRAPGGGIASGALSNNTTVVITVTNNIRVFARSFNSTHRNLTGANNPPANSVWSGPRVDTFYTSTPPLRITEIMYHPPALPGDGTNDVDNFEYVELRNIGGTPLNLNRFRLRGGIEFDFSNILLGAGQRVLVVKNLAAFASRYTTNGLIIAGVFTGNLANDGDHLKLEGGVREPVLDFDFSDGWYPVTDGAGFALQIVDDTAATSAWGLASGWRPSGQANGTPGVADPGAINVPVIYVNEALTHTDLPIVDAIELCNPNVGQVNVGGWFLTDDFGNPRKYRIPNGTMIGGNSYLVLYESNSFGVAFGLNSRGDELYLFSGDANSNLTSYAHGFDFGAQASGATFGRYVISSGNDHFVTQITPTLGTANAGPKVGPVVVGEIMYHPPDIFCGPNLVNDDDDEYVELYNNTLVDAPLFDPAHPTNTWRLRDAVDFDFPPGTVLTGGTYVLVVGFDPTNTATLLAFRAKYGLDASVPIYGPWEGNLNNSGDSVELQRPDLPQPPGTSDAGSVPYILAERVKYSDMAPWPAEADGSGTSLQRVNVNTYGNDVTNWVAVGPGPGRAYLGGDPPVITQQPTNRLVLEGTATTFVVGVSGTGPFTYQWRLNGTNIPGAFGSSYTIPSVSAVHQGNYSVRILGAAGSITSSNGSLTIAFLPRIITQPQSITVIAPTNGTSTNVTLTVLATGNPPIRYQWRLNGATITGQTNASLLLSNLGSTAQSEVYSVLVTDEIASILSSDATLRVLVRPTITQQPAPTSQVLLVGGTLTLTMSVSNNATLPMSYRWRRSGTTVTNIIINSYNCVLALTNYQTVGEANWNCIATNFGGFITHYPGFPSGQPGLSLNATVTVINPVAITLHPTNRAVASGTNVTFNAAASGTAPIGYQWWFNGTNRLANATNTSLNLTNVQLSNDGTYTLVATNAGSAATSQVAYLTILVPPSIVTQPTNQTTTLCSNVAFYVEAAGGGPLRYQWYFNGTTALSGATNNCLLIAPPSPASVGGYSVVVSNVLNAVTSQVATLTVTLGDCDGDGMADEWELANGLNPRDPADRDLDADGDGLKNWQEHVAGTNPQDAGSYLKIDQITAGGSATIWFNAVSNKKYTVQYNDTLPSVDWHKLGDVEAAPTNRPAATVFDATPSTSRAYRLVTPKQ